MTLAARSLVTVSFTVIFHCALSNTKTSCCARLLTVGVCYHVRCNAVVVVTWLQFCANSDFKLFFSELHSLKFTIFLRILKTRSHQCSIFDCHWLSHLSDINKGLIGANAILYSWKKAATGIFSILYVAFGTSVVLKMPACPDRIRIRAHIMKLLLFSQNNCGFIEATVIAVIFQNRRRTRARKPHT